MPDNLREIMFRLTNVIPERIILVSRGITVFGRGEISNALTDWTEKLHMQLFDPLMFYAWELFLYRCLTAL